jgi:multiple sugar transport system permease protein
VKRVLPDVAAIVLVSAYSLSPFLWQVVTSVKPAAQLGMLPPLLPTRLTLEHYAALLASPSLARMLLNSTLVAAATTLLALALGALAAFALSMLHVRGRLLILAVLLSVSMFPPIAVVSPLFLLVNALGLRDTLLGLVLTYTTFALPLAVWLLVSFFDRLPREIYHAARVDGCTALQALRYVVAPMARPAFAAAGLLVFIFSWNEFLLALTFTSTDAARTVPVGIALFPGLHEIPYGEIAAAAVLVTLPLAAVAFVFQRRVVEGLTAGAVKG